MKLAARASGKAPSIMKGIYRFCSNICSHPYLAFFIMTVLNGTLHLSWCWSGLPAVQTFEIRNMTNQTQDCGEARILYQTTFVSQNSSSWFPQFPDIYKIKGFLTSNIQFFSMFYREYKMDLWASHESIWVLIYILHNLPTLLELGVCKCWYLFCGVSYVISSQSAQCFSQVIRLSVCLDWFHFQYQTEYVCLPHILCIFHIIHREQLRLCADSLDEGRECGPRQKNKQGITGGNT